MSEIKQGDTEKLTAEFVAKLRSVFAQRLLSVCLYGSCVEAHTSSLKPLASVRDVNALVIVEDFKTSDLETVSSLSIWWEKKARALPLFLSQEEWENAADIFALEYADIKARHWLADGKDFYSCLSVNPKELRLICELEVYRKLIFLRQRLLLFKDQPEQLGALLKESIGSFNTLFRGIIRAYQPEQPSYWEATALYEALERLVPTFNAEPFRRVQEHLASARKFEKSSILPLFRDYLEQVALVNHFLNLHHETCSGDLSGLNV